MNLMKSFNIKYLKENLKKSRGLLAFLFGVFPLLDILLLIINITSNKDSIYLFNFNNISLVTIFGLYILPIILAFSLFGFVFKQKSVDFVMSKPINRKSIYITNILGGIFILTIFMLINTLIFGLFGLCCKNLVIPFLLLMDYFFYWLIAYIFVFVVSTLAITLSGNAMGSMVIILIVLCMYPFLKLSNAYFKDSHNETTYVTCEEKTCKPENYKCNTTSCVNHVLENEYEVVAYQKKTANFTAPVFFLNRNTSIYSTKSVVKMLILSVIYSLLGFYTFQKRKMENNEISFKNSKMHYFVKTLTMIPITFILYLLIKSSGGIGLLVALTTIIIYYGIYDLITRKALYQKTKSIFLCLLSFFLFMFYFGALDLLENKRVNHIEEIKELSIQGLTIKDSKKINEILKDTLEKEGKKKEGSSVMALANNKYYLNLYLTPEINKEINSKKEENLRKYLKELNNNKIYYIDSEVRVTKKLKKLIKKVLTDPKLDASLLNKNERLNFQIYIYENHDYTKIRIPYTLNEELTSEIMKIKNASYIKYLSDSKNIEDWSNQSSALTEEDDYIFSYVMSKNIEKFKNYLSNFNQKINHPIEISMHGNINSKYMIITDQEAFKKEFQKYKEALADDTYLKSILEDFNSNN